MKAALFKGPTASGEEYLSIEEVPDYAGLIYMNEDDTFDIIKKPKLQKIKSEIPIYIFNLRINMYTTKVQIE